VRPRRRLGPPDKWLMPTPVCVATGAVLSGACCGWNKTGRAARPMGSRCSSPPSLGPSALAARARRRAPAPPRRTFHVHDAKRLLNRPARELGADGQDDAAAALVLLDVEPACAVGASIRAHGLHSLVFFSYLFFCAGRGWTNCVCRLRRVRGWRCNREGVSDVRCSSAGLPAPPLPAPSSTLHPVCPHALALAPVRSHNQP